MTNLRVRHVVGVMGFAVLGLLSGCGGDGKVQRAKVSGTITYKGKPLVGANISFLPEKNGLPSGIGKTDANGKFVLGSYDPDDGAPVGRCKVAVSLRGPPKKLPKGMGEAFADQISDSGDPLIPLKYFSPESSGFSEEVVAGKNNVFTFELKD